MHESSEAGDGHQGNPPVIPFLVWMLDFLQTGIPLHFFGVRKARAEGFRRPLWRARPRPNHEVTWFHASSLGELEMLRPLIDDFVSAGGCVGVSVFSDSALPGLRDLPPSCVYAGLSPREKEWRGLFDHFQVRKLILAKYDFWPGLIQAAANRSAPVLVINARKGKSFFWIRFLFSLDQLPDFFLFGSTGDASIRPAVDPRWERVARRSEAASTNPEKVEKLQRWRLEVSRLPRPLGVIGSAWSEDLDVVFPGLGNFQGSLLIVPHSLASENISLLQEKIPDSLQGRVRVVSEMGILAELYSLADFAFVGGGFGKGIHSTIEPAIFGLPIATGPARVGDFPETRELLGRAQFEVVCNSRDVSEWIESLPPRMSGGGFLAEKRTLYRALLEECLRIR